MGKTQEFLKRKDINISAKTYFVDAMSGMAQGLFASLLVGTILSTVAKYIGMIDGAFFARFAHFIAKAGTASSAIAGINPTTIRAGMNPALKIESFKLSEFWIIEGNALASKCTIT